MYNYNYNTNNTGYESLFEEFGTLAIIISLLIIVFSIFVLIAQWKFFKKAGKHGWECLIPFYSNFALLNIAGLHWWYYLIVLICSFIVPFSSTGFYLLTFLFALYINYATYYNIGKRMKQNAVLYGLLGTLLNPILTLILGFGKETYSKRIKVNPNGPF